MEDNKILRLNDRVTSKDEIVAHENDNPTFEYKPRPLQRTKVIGYTGEIKWDTTKPNGTPRKLLDVSKATKLGWTYKTELEDGIRLSYEDFLNNPMRAER